MNKYIDAEKLRSVLQNTINSMKEKDVKGERYDAFLNGKLSICEELLGCIDSLQQEQPSLPANLDEAAEEWCKTNNKGIALSADKKSHYLAEGCEAFKAGAEWMSGQLQKIEGNLVDWYSTSDGKDYCCGIETDEAFEVPEGFYIRKK